MVTAKDREVLLPGVGVWHPRQRSLEGEVNRLRGLNIQQSVIRLIVNVHRPEDLLESLSAPKMAELKECSVNYIKGFTFASLKRALETAAFDPQRLRTFRVTGTAVISPWQVETLRTMFRCISGARLFLFDRISERPFKQWRDEVITTGTDEWFRLNGDNASLYATNLPWCEAAIREGKPTKLIVDCDDQFNVPSLVGGIITDGSLPLETLTLQNVTTTSQYLLGFLDKINIPGLKRLEITSSDPLMQSKWSKAATMYVRTRLPGVHFWFNGEKRI